MDRAEGLTQGESLELCDHLEEFPELVDAFTLPGLETVLVGAEHGGHVKSKVNLEGEGWVRVTGVLRTPAPHRLVGGFRRRLAFDPEIAVHEHLVLEPEFRGRGLGLRFVQRALPLYDSLGLRRIHLQAALETGRWYWAHMGFDFFPPGGCDAVRDWAVGLCAALGHDDLRPDQYHSARQFARMGGARRLSLEEIAEAVPERREKIEKVATKNGHAMDERLAFGRAVLLTGPQWDGHLELRGAPRLAFEAAASEKLRAADAKREEG
jgi:GNAT superfamily N-acetyltransferase